MMKNLCVFRISPETPLLLGSHAMAELLAKRALQPCTGYAMKTKGWSIATQDTFCYHQGRHWLLRYGIETREIPGNAIDDKVDAMVATFLKENGDAEPDALQRADMRRAAVDELLPHAFRKHKFTAVWIDLDRAQVYVNTSSYNAAADIVVALMDAFGGAQALKIEGLPVSRTAQRAMGAWIDAPQDLTPSITLGTDLDLRGESEDKPLVRWQHLDLTGIRVRDEIKGHRLDAMQVARLGLTYENEAGTLFTHFVLDDLGVFRSIKCPELAAHKSQEETIEDQFGADFLLMADTLAELVNEVWSAIGKPRMSDHVTYNLSTGKPYLTPEQAAEEEAQRKKKAARKASTQTVLVFPGAGTPDETEESHEAAVIAAGREAMDERAAARGD